EPELLGDVQQLLRRHPLQVAQRVLREPFGNGRHRPVGLLRFAAVVVPRQAVVAEPVAAATLAVAAVAEPVAAVAAAAIALVMAAAGLVLRLLGGFAVAALRAGRRCRGRGWGGLAGWSGGRRGLCRRACGFGACGRRSGIGGLGGARLAHALGGGFASVAPGGVGGIVGQVAISSRM